MDNPESQEITSCSETSDVESIPLNKRVKHRSLWFEDGSIVLATPRMLFKVYRDVLANKSPIFRDMFSLPQARSPAETGDEIMDGVCVVHMQDSEVGLGYFSSALYDMSYYDGIENYSWDVSAAILRLGTKYQVNVLRKKLIARMAKDYPDTFDAYERLKDTQTLKLTSHPGMLALAHQTQTLTFLPFALYGITMRDDIPEQDTVSCLRAREKLRQAFWNLVDSSGWSAARAHEEDRYSRSRYRDPDDSCSSRKLQLMNSVQWRDIINKPDILGFHIDRIDMSNVCNGCSSKLQGAIENGRHQVWNDLPGYFSLGTWESLRSNSLLDGA